jgi:C1A family cysteine protease
LDVINERNAAEIANGGEAVHGITRFTDLLQEEFNAQFTTADVSLKTPVSERLGGIYNETSNIDADSLVDWTGVYTTPVKDQAQCGSCWAFSATEQIESDIMRNLDTTLVLSPQQIVSCDRTSQGCNGGWTESAYKYVANAGGIETDKDYPYTSGRGVTGSCKADSSGFVATIKSYTTVNGESAMADYVQSTGPLSVCLDANLFNSYTGGIMTVCGNQVDHCVQAVGVLPDASTGYWKVRNSWGTSWGEKGYIRLKYGKNTCDITNDPTYVTGAQLV